MYRALIVAAMAVVLFVVAPVSAAPLDGTFTYQGQLTDGGTPITGTVDVRFRLWDAAVAGLQVGPTIDILGVVATNGLFKADLNFGVGALSGDMRWLEIEVQNPAGIGGFVNLGRQEMLGSPYSIQTRGIFVDDLLNVGIGTTMPSAKLHVSGPSSSIRVGDTGSQQVFLAGPIGNLPIDIFHTNGGTRSGAYVETTEGLQLQLFDAPGSGFGGAVALIGSSGTSGNGFIQLYSKSSSSPTVLIRADANNSVDTDESGLLQLSSLGTLGSGGQISLLNNDGAETLNLLGGTSGNGGTFSMFEPTLGNETVSLLSDPTGRGADLRMNSEDGFLQFRVSPDFNGQGVYVQMNRNNSSNGFVFDGNLNGTGEPRLSISGSARSAVFAMGSTGSSSVSLPTDAIQASEILDEPGVASEARNTGVALTGGFDTILSKTITCPANGYCVVIGSAQMNVSHATGTSSTANFGVSNVAGSLPVNQDVANVVPGGAASGTYIHPITVHGTFSVTAGVNTFYFIGNEVSGSYSVNDLQLSVIFIPTAYGVVTSTLLAEPGVDNDASAPQMYPMSANDVYAELLEAAESDQIRRDAELADYRREMLELRTRLEEVEAQQRLGDSTSRRASPPIKDSGLESGAVIDNNTSIFKKVR